MKKYVVMILIAIVLIIGGGTFAYFHFANGGPWQGTWWGVQDAGVNWSGDHIRNLETVTFTQNDDKTITVDHKVQQGSREVPGSLTGTGRIDGVWSSRRKTEARSWLSPTARSPDPLIPLSRMRTRVPSH